MSCGSPWPPRLAAAPPVDRTPPPRHPWGALRTTGQASRASPGGPPAPAGPWDICGPKPERHRLELLPARHKSGMANRKDVHYVDNINNMREDVVGSLTPSTSHDLVTYLSCRRSSIPSNARFTESLISSDDTPGMTSVVEVVKLHCSTMDISSRTCATHVMG